MDYKDYYKVMGLKRDASAADIKTAYRKLARKYHPDVNKEPDAEEKFKELGEAYEVLKDPKKRKAYDQFSQNPHFDPNQYTYQRGPMHGGPHYQSTHDFSDFFESLFGGGGFAHEAQHRAGADYHADISISLEEAWKGAVKELSLASENNTPQVLKVKIPAGVKSGQKIRLSGQGGFSPGKGTRGDLYLTVHVQKHPEFDVIDNNIYFTLAITPWEAALGTTIVVPTLGGKVDLKIPAGSQGGQSLRLKNRGLPGKAPGDQYVILKIFIPQPITEASKELYKQLANATPNPRK